MKLNIILTICALLVFMLAAFIWKSAYTPKYNACDRYGNEVLIEQPTQLEILENYYGGGGW